MRLLKLMTLSILVLTVAFVYTGSAAACDKTKTAAAKTASAETASASGCASKATSETASTKTAGAAGCVSGATASVAGIGCTSGATAQTAGAGCSAEKASANKVAMETVRMPSGAFAVFYSSTDATMASHLQKSAEGEVAGFSCPLVKEMASAENCKVEMAATKDGVMFLCTSDSEELIEKFAKNYEVAMSGGAEATDGE